MPQYQKGRTTDQAHVRLPAGTVEEEFGRRGFFGRATHLYRLRPPTDWTRIDGPLRPHALDLNVLDAPADDDLAALFPTDVLVNDDVRLGVWQLDGTPDHFTRDADADLVLFVHRGAGRLTSDFGTLVYRAGDYLVVPRGTTFRFEVDDPTWLLAIASVAEVGPPDRGLLGRHALWDESALRLPEIDPHDVDGDFRIVVRHRGQLSTIHYPHHPLDVVGWKGDLAVFALNVDQLRPISSYNYHVPPSAHTTFMLGEGAVLCSFVPRPLETADDVLKVPFYHRNIDYDEVIFYHDGEFFSRAGIKPGNVTWHPQGIHHGPQPQAVAKAGTKDFTNEIAVMLDTRNPLTLTPAGEGLELPDYWRSWQE